ncbi:unnamed protein product, partial [Pylaiella littoralis]
AKDTEVSLCIRRKRMTQAWDDLEKGWQDLGNRMAVVGITEPVAFDERIAWLNVGGLRLNIAQSVFEGKKGSPAAPWSLAGVFAAVWDKRLPRDSEGRTVLDESPACVKHLVHTHLKSQGKDSNLDGAPHVDTLLADDEQPNVPWVSQRMALREAQIELVQAGDKVTASANALAAVYGPNVAAGKEDPVVELSVRGSRVITLLSTLRACPESMLAIMFNEDRWPATDKDVDEHGRRLIDCSPSVFAKVLDVLRARKRAGWERTASSSSDQKSDDLVRVIIKAGDRDAFEEFVEKHFPGDFQSFIMDCVE